jgi:hypothetical protein
MEAEEHVVIEVIGEGVADVGSEKKSDLPTAGIVPILLHKLCGKPNRMRIKRRRFAFLIQKGLAKKVQFAKRQAFYSGSHAAVFVIDSEGGVKELNAKQSDLETGRGRELLSFPMAIGVAHPCIESWLLASPEAIRRGLGLKSTPQVPTEPETLAAPCQNRRDNPKTALSAAAIIDRELSAEEKDRIAVAINDLEHLRTLCPLGFAPFADEVEDRIRPLFVA